MVYIKVPDEIIEKIRAKSSGQDVEGYVVELITQHLCTNEPAAQNTEQAYSEEDEEKVKERLKSLGYLD